MTSVGIIAVALAAAAGGALWFPRDGDADRGAAVVRGVIGAGAAAIVASLLYGYLRKSGHLRRLGPAASSLALSAGLIIVALGAIVGASTAPLKEDQARPRPDEPAGDSRISEHAEASFVDADGDGLADRDADSNLIIAFDPEGDGTFQGRLVPCREESNEVDSWSDEIRLDFGCDGDIDATAPMNLQLIDGGQFTGPMYEGDLRPEGGIQGSLGDDEPGGDLDGDEVEQLTPGNGADGNDDDNDDNDNDNNSNSDKDGGGSIGKVLLTLLAIAAIAAIGFAVARVLRNRERRRSTGPDIDTRGEPEEETVDTVAVDAAIEESIETLLGHPDPRLAIRAAYAVLLDALAEAGFPRRSFEAPEEHLSRCLIGLNVTPEPMRNLLRLFAVARFSTHDVTEDDRAAAVAALRVSQDELRARVGAQPAGAPQ